MLCPNLQTTRHQMRTVLFSHALPATNQKTSLLDGICGVSTPRKLQRRAFAKKALELATFPRSKIFQSELDAQQFGCSGFAAGMFAGATARRLVCIPSGEVHIRWKSTRGVETFGDRVPRSWALAYRAVECLAAARHGCQAFTSASRAVDSLLGIDGWVVAATKGLACPDYSTVDAEYDSVMNGDLPRAITARQLPSNNRTIARANGGAKGQVPL